MRCRVSCEGRSVHVMQSNVATKERVHTQGAARRRRTHTSLGRAPEIARAVEELTAGQREEESGVLATLTRSISRREEARERAASEYLTSSTGKLCDFDTLLQLYAAS